MKKMPLIIAALFVSLSAQAANHVGQCAMPKSTVQKDGRLAVKPIVVKASPKDKEGKVELKLWTMSIVGQDGAMVQVVEAESKKPIGWVQFKDLELQEPRNCNL